MWKRAKRGEKEEKRLDTKWPDDYNNYIMKTTHQPIQELCKSINYLLEQLTKYRLTPSVNDETGVIVVVELVVIRLLDELLGVMLDELNRTLGKTSANSDT